jgi:hypothetical protein
MIIALRLDRLLLLCAIITCSSVGYSQIVRGRVLDQSTAKAVPFASIYFSGTTIGTTSDDHGFFELNYPKDLSNPLTISSVGFYSEILDSFKTGDTLKVDLKPKTIDLPGIEVTGDKSRDIRKRYFPIFRKEFLGKKINSNHCVIKNEGDIRLTYDGNQKILKAFASRPIQIRNELLGYEISYYLDRFEFSLVNKSLVFTGNYIFTPIFTKDNKQQKEFEINRVNAYLGSRMHFFRSLWKGNSELSGFFAVNKNNEPIPQDKIGIGEIITANGVSQKVLIMLGPFGVYYKTPLRMTMMVLKNGTLLFDNNGYFNPMGIVWEGFMANKRISDLLPYEYIPDANSLKNNEGYK